LLVGCLRAVSGAVGYRIVCIVCTVHWPQRVSVNVAVDIFVKKWYVTHVESVCDPNKHTIRRRADKFLPVLHYVDAGC
jgi:hypothetical protein